MKKFKRKFTLRTALVTAATLALIASATVFMAVSAADEVSPSDVSPADSRSASVSVVVSPTQTNEAPDSLGAPVITMTTAKSKGETLNLDITGNNVFIDYGDGNPVLYPGDRTVKGSNITIYGDNITDLYCFDNKLSALDVSHNTSLKILECPSNRLTALTLPHESDLWMLDCSDNELTSLDVSKNTNYLEEVKCSNNQLTSLNVSDSSVVRLFCDHNQLTALDLSKAASLGQLVCNNNELTSLDLSKNTELAYLNCENNKLTSLDLSNQSANPFDVLNCRKNQLTMPMIFDLVLSRADAENCIYAPQTHLIPSTVKAGEEIDLSSEATVHGKATKFTWFDSEGNAVTPATANGGKFTFGNDAAGKTLCCRMTNEALPAFAVDGDGNDNLLTTTQVKVEAAEPEQPDDNSIPVNDNPMVSEAEYTDGTQAEADGNAIDVQDLHLIVSNIEGNEKNAVLDAISNYAKTYKAVEGNTALYDITLVDNKHAHVTVTEGQIRVCLKYPDGLDSQREKYTFRLYHRKSDGTVEEIPIVCKEDGIWFESSDFSPYALVWNPKSTGTAPGTGESALLIYVMAAVCALSLAGACYILYRRKRQAAQ